MILALSRATSVPDPIAIPTSACIRAGASLTPSPTMATFRPPRISVLIRSTLSSGSSSALISLKRLIGTIRREYLDQTLFWTAADLEEKLRVFQHYFNRHRTHSGLKGRLPEPDQVQATLSFASYRWQSIVGESIRHP